MKQSKAHHYKGRKAPFFPSFAKYISLFNLCKAPQTKGFALGINFFFFFIRKYKVLNYLCIAVNETKPVCSTNKYGFIK